MTKEYVPTAFQILTHCGESFPINKVVPVYSLSEWSSKSACPLNSAYFTLLSAFP